MVNHSECVLITGIGGFTGRRLASALSRLGNRIVGLNHADGTPVDLLRKTDVETAIGEISPSVVVHLAAISAPVQASLKDLYLVNTVGTLHLLEALKQLRQSPRLVVLASSATVYAPSLDGEPLEESSRLKPTNHYGVSKLAAEMTAQLYGTNFPVLVVRPFNYIGAGQSTMFLLGKVAAHVARSNQPLRLGNLGLKRDFSDVDDVIEAYVRLINRCWTPADPYVVNICSGQAYELREIVETMIKFSGRPVKIEIDPALVRVGEPDVIIGSRRKLESLVGSWEQKPIEQTLTAMVNAAQRSNIER